LVELFNHHDYRLIDPSPKEKSVACDFVLDRGKTVRGTVADPDGKSLAGAVVSGLSAFGREPRTHDSAAFTAVALDPRHPRRLLFGHGPRKLAGFAHLRGDEQAPQVRLQPWGTMAGRVLDAEGKPRAGAEVHLMYKTDGIPHAVYDSALWMKPPSEKIMTDREGKFRVEGLVPGLPLRMSISGRTQFFDLARGFGALAALQPGEVRDLGDIAMK
jgi:hypothetical protein